MKSKEDIRIGGFYNYDWIIYGNVIVEVVSIPNDTEVQIYPAEPMPEDFPKIVKLEDLSELSEDQEYWLRHILYGRNNTGYPPRKYSDQEEEWIAQMAIKYSLTLDRAIASSDRVKYGVEMGQKLVEQIRKVRYENSWKNYTEQKY